MPAHEVPANAVPAHEVQLMQCQPKKCQPMPCQPMLCQPMSCQPMKKQPMPCQPMKCQPMPCQPMICSKPNQDDRIVDSLHHRVGPMSERSAVIKNRCNSVGNLIQTPQTILKAIIWYRLTRLPSSTKRIEISTNYSNFIDNKKTSTDNYIVSVITMKLLQMNHLSRSFINNNRTFDRSQLRFDHNYHRSIGTTNVVHSVFTMVDEHIIILHVQSIFSLVSQLHIGRIIIMPNKNWHAPCSPNNENIVPKIIELLWSKQVLKNFRPPFRSISTLFNCEPQIRLQLNIQLYNMFILLSLQNNFYYLSPLSYLSKLMHIFDSEDFTRPFQC